MVNSRAYTIACDDGEEEHLKELAAHVDAKAREVLGSVGQVGDARMLLMAALLIADEHHELAEAPGAPPGTGEKNSCICGRKRRKAPPPTPWKAPQRSWKTLPPLRTPRPARFHPQLRLTLGRTVTVSRVRLRCPGALIVLIGSCPWSGPWS